MAQAAEAINKTFSPLVQIQRNGEVARARLQGPLIEPLNDSSQRNSIVAN
jgi:hypothetical protein